jgi:arylsulfatase A-like enzyme
MDLFPTVCDLAGIPVPAGLDGKSLKGTIKGKSKGVRDRLFSCYKDVQRAIRDNRWKLIRYPNIDKTQLFDLRTDPAEMKDLSNDKNQAGRIKAMTAELIELQKLYGDKTPLSLGTKQ